MEALGKMFAGWTLANPVALVLLLAFLALAWLFAARVRAGWGYSLRKIAGFEAIKQVAGQAAEQGKLLHMALGTGGIGGATTLETLAAMTTLEYLAQQAALCDIPLLVNVADPTTLPAAQESLYRGYAQAGYPDEYDSTQVRFLAPEPVAYAAGVMSTLNLEELSANVMIGVFGEEFLLMSETGARKGIPQVGGTVNPQTLPFAYVSTDHALIGEEIFASGAYLRGDPGHIGGLLAQDVMRTAIVLTAVVGVVLKSLGWL